VDRQRVSDLLIEAIITVESRGNPQAVGSQGERGLMQIMSATWEETTAKMFGQPLSFDRAFDPVLNQRVGRVYLNYLQSYLEKSRGNWGASERDLLLACYNAGPQKVRRAEFQLHGLPAQTREYIQRVSSLHDELLKEFARPAEQMMVMGPLDVPPSGS
jgi:soluble lytic murein transglycosylase-like protein